MRATKIAQRLLLTAAASAGIVGTLGVVPAHATDDWNPGTITPQDARFGQYRITGSYAAMDIQWSGYNVAVRGSVKDTAGDGYGAALKVRYQVRISGTWSWHERIAARAAGNGKVGYLAWQRSNYPTRYVQVWACLYDTPNHMVACGGPG